jgi:2'-5' RNA ligase
VQAIITAIDDPFRETFENVWGELKAVFGLKGMVGATRPHFMYQVAERYDARGSGAIIERIARETAPFVVETAGLGIFRGRLTVLAMTLHREGEVAKLHRRIWDEVTAWAGDVRSEYAAATWVPHVTLAAGDLGDDAPLQAISQFLARRDHRWQIPVTNVCLSEDTRSESAQWRRFDLQTPAATAPRAATRRAPRRKTG